MFGKIECTIILQNRINCSVIKQKSIFDIKIHFNNDQKNYNQTKYCCKDQFFWKKKMEIPVPKRIIISLKKLVDFAQKR